MAQRPIVPLLAPVGDPGAVQAPGTGRNGAYDALRLADGLATPPTVADSSHAARPLAPVMTIGLNGAVIGGWWGYNRDRHTTDPGFIPHGGLIGGALLGLMVGVNVVTIYNIVTTRR